MQVSSQIGSLEYAAVLLKQVKTCSVFVWNTVIRGYERSRRPWRAIELYYRMLKQHVYPDKFTFPFVLKACDGASAIGDGKRIHCRILKGPLTVDLFVKNSLIFMYARCGDIHSAHVLFDSTPQKDLVSWNTLIDGYVKHSRLFDATKLFEQMPEQDLFSWNVMIDGYSKCGQLKYARKLFDEMPEQDIVSWNIMIDGYARNGDLRTARILFDQTPSKNVVTWGVMINGYVECGQIAAAHSWFEKMPYKNVVSWNCLINGYAKCADVLACQKLFYLMLSRNMTTWNTMLDAHAKHSDIELAHQFFKTMPTKDVVSWNIMVDVYANAGKMRAAREIFECMPCRDVVSWNTMISGYKHNAEPKEAVEMYFNMHLFGEKPNCFTMAVVLSAIADIGFHAQGREVCAQVDECKFSLDGIVGVALIDMYAKCGFVNTAKEIFTSISHKSKDHWNAMISGFAIHGYGSNAVSLFQGMEKCRVVPDDITFVALLNACSHAGLVQEGYYYFGIMRSIYGLVPKIQHYGCMVDLLSRAGLLKDAIQLINNMPLTANDVVWRALLGASRNHCNLDVAEHAARELIELVPQDSSSYVLLANIYAYKGNSVSARDIWKAMTNRGVIKSHGSSSIEFQGSIHEFVAGDTSHPQIADIYPFLNCLTNELLLAGYLPDMKQSLFETG